MKKLLVVAAFFLAAPFVSNAQEEEEDASKMVREVISVEMERPTPAPVVAAPVEEVKGKKGKKKPVVEEPPPEEVIDTLGSTMPATIAELSKRANYWYTTKNKKFEKSSGGGSGSQVVCNVKFNYKPKELNPANDVEGDITMRVTIDCKEGKYRYTIDKIEHVSKRGKCSGGDVFNEVPTCGSMNLNSVIWKQIKSAGLSSAKIVAEDLKAKMAKPVPTVGKSDW
jgi:hypothetical protein